MSLLLAGYSAHVMDVLNIRLDIDAGQRVQLVIDLADIFGMPDAHRSKASGILSRFCRRDTAIDVVRPKAIPH